MIKAGMMFLWVMMASFVQAQDVPSLAPGSIAALRAQVEVERGKEQELQLLQLEVDRLKLEVEKKKAVVELEKIDGRRSDGGLSADPREQPFISLHYVVIAPGRKEAVVDLDGTVYRVGEGDEVGGRVVKSISEQGISLGSKDGSEVFLRTGA
jgi:hypothetical protein